MHLTPTSFYGVGACGLWPGIRRPRRGVWGGLKRYVGSNTLIRYCIGALGGEARWGHKVAAGGWENRGPTGSGATWAWLGGFRVGTGVPGRLREPPRELFRVLSELKISPRSPRRSHSVPCWTSKRVVTTTSCSKKDGRVHGSKHEACMRLRNS